MWKQPRAFIRGTTAAWLIALAIATALSCIGRPKGEWTLAHLHVVKPCRQLVAAYPEHFARPFTLLIMTDETATCGIKEAQWWDDWEEFLLTRNCGFVLATSKEDSIDLVIAAQLDSVHAPVLVLPHCKRYVGELGVPFLPMDVLIDSTARVLYSWGNSKDSAGQAAMLNTIDSIISNPQRTRK